MTDQKRWRVTQTGGFAQWYARLRDDDVVRLDAALSILAERGPSLGRPLVDTVHGSRHANMKELRVGAIRVLFAFDRQRVAVLLVAGDKRGNWKAWYEEAIPIADRLLDRHLRSSERGG